MNFVVDASVSGVPVTINVTDVPWNFALDSILKANRLGVEVNGNILRVATLDVLKDEAKIRAEEESARTALRDAQLLNQPLFTEFIRLNYARASGSLGVGERGRRLVHGRRQLRRRAPGRAATRASSPSSSAGSRGAAASRWTRAATRSSSRTCARTSRPSAGSSRSSTSPSRRSRSRRASSSPAATSAATSASSSRPRSSARAAAAASRSRTPTNGAVAGLNPSGLPGGSQWAHPSPRPASARTARRPSSA